MEQIQVWRLFITGAVFTCMVAILCVFIVLRSQKIEIEQAVFSIRAQYEALRQRIEYLSEKMDAVEEKLLAVLIKAHPEEAG